MVQMKHVSPCNSPTTITSSGLTGANVSTAASSKSNFLGSTIEEKTRKLLGWTDGYQPTIQPSAPPRCQKMKHPQLPSIPNILHHHHHHHPYALQAAAARRFSSPSPASILDSQSHVTPPPSPMTVGSPLPPPPPYFPVHSPEYLVRAHTVPNSPVTPNRTFTPATPRETFETLRQMVPSSHPTPTAGPVPEASKYRNLVSLVSHVSELDARLAQLKEQTRDLNAVIATRIANAKASGTPLPPEIESLPDGVSPPSVPEDLLNIDVTAFKTMVSSPSNSSGSMPSPAIYDSSSSVEPPASVDSVPSVPPPSGDSAIGAGAGAGTGTGLGGSGAEPVMDMPAACASGIDTVSLDNSGGGITAW